MAATLPGAAAGAAALSCPCGRLAPAGKGKTGKPLAYAACCQPWHLGQPAPTPEALMRSRYSAFVLGLADYLRATWHPSTRPPTLDLEAGTHWLGLEVRASRLLDDHCANAGSEGAHDAHNLAKGEVEFVARSRVAGKGQRLHERSRFLREDGRWWYVDGDMLG
jgi:SEC-C motif-containing protein